MNTIISLILSLVFSFSVFPAAVTIPDEGNTYYRPCVITTTTEEGLTAVDNAGNTWRWEGKTLFRAGEYVLLFMGDNGTTEETDDIIYDVFYAE